MDPLSTIDPLDRSQLSQRALVLSKRSLVDNSFARACSLKRSRAESNIAQPPLKRWKSQANLAHGYQSQRCAVKIIASSSSVSSGSSARSGISKRADEEMCPYAFIETVLIGENESKMVKPVQALRESEFLPITEERIAAFSTEAIAAARNSDLGALRRLHSEGHDLRCCNRFGESLLHTACRRASSAVVKFLLEEASICARIRDDYGRTPLHDACWRGTPELEIVEALLAKEPRLAYVKDVRGHRPFQYARTEHWGVWKEFLRKKRDLILSCKEDP